MSARESIAEALGKFQEQWEDFLSCDGPPDPTGIKSLRLTLHLTTAFLLEKLRQVDEADADRTARWLAETVESGGDAVEWVYEWLQDMASGRPLSMPDLTEETS